MSKPSEAAMRAIMKIQEHCDTYSDYLDKELAVYIDEEYAPAIELLRDIWENYKCGGEIDGMILSALDTLGIPVEEESSE